ncbi:MAG: FHA domain-containing protein [Micromonosporaceae bacterium]
MRFDVTQALDAIEQSLTTDAALAQAVVDLGEVAWFVELDGGREVNLLRAGHLVDAFARYIGQDAVAVYPVAGRALLADQSLTSKERMVLGRWSDDGLIEVVPRIEDRVAEVADLTGLPVLTRALPPGLEHRYPWLRHQPGRVLWLRAHQGGAALNGAPPPPAEPGGAGAMLLGRVWACPRRECPSFGVRRLVTQSVPHLRAGVPSCPRHGEPLVNAGARPPAMVLVVVIDGKVRTRFVVRAGRPAVVGRAPEQPDGLAVGSWLREESVAMVSRTHVRLELHGDALRVTDLSTNGTVIRTRGTPATPAEQIQLAGGQTQVIGRFDIVELHEGVELVPVDALASKSGSAPGSVMGDAPTISIRPP